MESLNFNTLAERDQPANIRINFTYPETRMIVLSEAEDHTIVSSFIWTKHRNVTVRQTDGQTVRGYYSGLHCKHGA